MSGNWNKLISLILIWQGVQNFNFDISDKIYLCLIKLTENLQKNAQNMTKYFANSEFLSDNSKIASFVP